jgi:hypothetical protein
VPASAQSVSRLYCAAEDEINSIVTVGCAARDVGLFQDPNLRTPFTSRIKSRLEENKAFRLAHLPLPRLAG